MVFDQMNSLWSGDFLLLVGLTGNIIAFPNLVRYIYSLIPKGFSFLRCTSFGWERLYTLKLSPWTSQLYSARFGALLLKSRLRLQAKFFCPGKSPEIPKFLNLELLTKD